MEAVQQQLPNSNQPEKDQKMNDEEDTEMKEKDESNFAETCDKAKPFTQTIEKEYDSA